MRPNDRPARRANGPDTGTIWIGKFASERTRIAAREERRSSAGTRSPAEPGASRRRGAPEPGEEGAEGHGQSQRGRGAGLGGRRERVAVRVVEVRRGGAVDEAAAVPLLGREPGSHEVRGEPPRADSEEGMGADRLQCGEDSDVALRGERGDVARGDLLRRPLDDAGREEERRGGSAGGERRQEPAAQVEADEDRRAGAERRERCERAGGGEAGDARAEGETGRDAASPAGESGRGDERREDEGGADVSRVADEGRGEEPRLGGFDGKPQDAREPLEAREGAGHRPAGGEEGERPRGRGLPLPRRAPGEEREGGRSGSTSSGSRPRGRPAANEARKVARNAARAAAATGAARPERAGRKGVGGREAKPTRTRRAPADCAASFASRVASPESSSRTKKGSARATRTPSGARSSKAAPAPSLFVGMGRRIASPADW